MVGICGVIKRDVEPPRHESMVALVMEKYLLMVSDGQ